MVFRVGVSLLALLLPMQEWLLLGSFLGGVLPWLWFFRHQIRSSRKEQASPAADPVADLHHRVNNNLQMISSLLRLQSRAIKDPGIKAAMLEGQHRIHALALVHQKSFSRQGQLAVEMKALFQAIGKRLLTPASFHMSLRVSMPPLEVELDTAIPLGLIAHELMFQTIRTNPHTLGPSSIRLSLLVLPSGQLELHCVRPFSDSAVIKTSLSHRLVRLLCLQLEGECQESMGKMHTTTLRLPFSASPPLSNTGHQA